MPAYKFKNEEELISIAKNNPRVFGELYDAYYPRIFGYIFRITGDHALACDITAETFLKAWLKIGSFQWKGVSISSWFFKIATNELNQYFRKKKYSPQILRDLSFFEEKKPKVDSCFGNENNEVTAKMDKADEFMQLRRKLNTLSPKYQAALALRYFEELSIAEISHILGKKENTVKSLLSRGLEKLRILFP
ncbi:MAG TPA: RNA polymerase sigma factor [Puia sp.]|jgi:RNA polymerase sigma-70 factor (ECF subfamily)|nr:RNA polymerase sigma factor [Puia sp.]